MHCAFRTFFSDLCLSAKPAYCHSHEVGGKATSLFSASLPRARYPTIACVFCLHSFTREDKLQIYSGLWVKAKEETSFTSFMRFAFTNNSQTFSSLLPFGEGNEDKIQELHRYARVRARENDRKVWGTKRSVYLWECSPRS